MKYVGTRTGEFGKFSFEEAIFSPGYLPDGGLLIPETTPQISPDTLAKWAALSYPELCKEIFALFVGEDEVPRSALNGIVDQAMTKMKLPEVIRVAGLSNGLNMMEMFHSVTLAFKDISLSTLGQFMDYFLAKRKRKVILVVGTSGDTGAAAIEAVRGLDCIDIIVLVPRCSDVQKLSMFTAIDRNVHIFSAPDMTSDDVDLIIKPVCTNQAYKERHNLGTLNSINWGRVMGQIVNFFYGYFRACQSCDKVVEFVIPTGAGGNMTGACIAQRMGLPIRIVCAVNTNDIVHRTLAFNDYSMGTLTQTIAPAMDIQLPYNFERLMWLFSDGDCAQVKEIMSRFETGGKSSMETKLWKKMKQVVSSYSVEESCIKAAMQRCWQEDSYTLCPHSAIAVAYHYHKLANPDMDSPPIRVCVATASPAKFPEAMTAAGLATVPSATVDRWMSLPTRISLLRNDGKGEAALRARIEGITRAREFGHTGDLYEMGMLSV